jgi:hypothetical protein
MPTLEAEGGAVPLQSRFYIERATDSAFRGAVARRDSIVLVKGARQMGKTSLLARGLQEARDRGARVVLTDFQALSAIHVASPDALCRALGNLIAEQLDLDVSPEDVWDPSRGANANFERFLRREVLEPLAAPLVWGLDEVDRLFTTPFSDEIFAMFRSWHNKRALEPEGPWKRLTLAISFATEAHLFIRDLNQSPFNVGTRVVLSDFSPKDVAELNRRYGAPLASGSELDRFYDLLGGHPYLTRRALHELAAHPELDLETLERRACREDGLFNDHLRRILVLLARDPDLCDAVRQVVHGGPCPTPESFYRLRSAGVLAGEDADHARPRCRLYRQYLAQNLS